MTNQLEYLFGVAFMWHMKALEVRRRIHDMIVNKQDNSAKVAELEQEALRYDAKAKQFDDKAREENGETL